MLAPLLKMLEAVLDLIVPLIMARIINIGIAGNDRGYIIDNCLIMILLAAAGLLISAVAQFFAAKAATSASSSLRAEMMKKITSLTAPDIEKEGTGALLTRQTADINQVENGINMFLRLFLRSPFIVLGSLAMSFLIYPKAALLFLIVIAVLFVSTMLLMSGVRRLFRKSGAVRDKLTERTSEILKGQKVIRAYRRARDEAGAFGRDNRALAASDKRAGFLAALSSPVTTVVINLGIVAVLVTGRTAVLNGDLKLGDLVAFVNYMTQILTELLKFSALITTVTKAIAAGDRVDRILSLPVSRSYGKETVESTLYYDIENRYDPATGQKIASSPVYTLKNVSFRYPDAAGDCVSDISFSVPEGSFTGIAGGTGSGKSSLLSLLAGRYEASNGELLLYEKPIMSYTRESLSSTVAVVPQYAKLLSGTVRETVSLGKPDATDEEIREALRLAACDDMLLSMPYGLDTPVAEGGRSLSGGQRQRLSIARALLVRPRILILDDCLSALDYVTDRKVRTNLRHLPFPCTVLISSQRISSIREADSIYVLDKGKLCGKGSHKELKKNCPVYREMAESQERGR